MSLAALVPENMYQACLTKRRFFSSLPMLQVDITIASGWAATQTSPSTAKAPQNNWQAGPTSARMRSRPTGRASYRSAKIAVSDQSHRSQGTKLVQQQAVQMMPNNVICMLSLEQIRNTRWIQTDRMQCYGRPWTSSYALGRRLGEKKKIAALLGYAYTLPNVAQWQKFPCLDGTHLPLRLAPQFVEQQLLNLLAFFSLRISTTTKSSEKAAE